MTTLKEYTTAMHWSAVERAKREARWPECELVLTEEEKTAHPSETLTQEEQLSVIVSRAEAESSFVSLSAETASATPVVAEALKQGAECYVLPYYRHCVVVKKPTQDAFDEHQLDLDDVEERKNKMSSKDVVSSRRAAKTLFVSRHLVFPRTLPSDGALNLTDQAYNLLVNVCIDQEGIDRVKISG
jgi:hypothetical protein